MNYNAPEEFYRSILLSFLGENIIWVDENGVETTIRAVVFRRGTGTSVVLRANNGNSMGKQRSYMINIANDSEYGRIDVKINKEKVKFNLNRTDSGSLHTFRISDIVSSDQAKYVLRCQL